MPRQARHDLLLLPDNPTLTKPPPSHKLTRFHSEQVVRASYGAWVSASRPGSREA